LYLISFLGSRPLSDGWFIAFWVMRMSHNYLSFRFSLNKHEMNAFHSFQFIFKIPQLTKVMVGSVGSAKRKTYAKLHVNINRENPFCCFNHVYKHVCCIFFTYLPSLQNTLVKNRQCIEIDRFYPKNKHKQKDLFFWVKPYASSIVCSN
jgi:hypothetical protein